MERLAYPTNVMQEMGIDVTEITDETRQNFAKLLDNGVISDRLTYCIKEYYRNNRTLEDLASELNVTRERVRQLIASAKEKLTTYRPYILGIDGYITEKERLQDEIEKLEVRLAKLKAVAKDIDLEALEEKYSISIFKDTSVSIDKVDMSVRTYNCLKKEGIETLDDLFSKSEYELTQIHNLGNRSITEIKNLALLYGRKIS